MAVRELPVLTIVLGRVGIAAVILLLVIRLKGIEIPRAPGLLWTFAIAVICTAFAYGLYSRIRASTGATNLSLVTMLVPASAILLGIMFLGEHLLAHHIAGLGLIVAGLTVMDGRLLDFVLRGVRP